MSREGGPIVIANPAAPGRADAWSEAQTQDGEVYYYNAATGESSWEIPAGANVIEITGASGARNGKGTKVKKTFDACFDSDDDDDEASFRRRRKRYTLSGEEAQSAFRGPIIASIVCGGLALVAVAAVFFLADQGTIAGDQVTGYLALVCSPCVSKCVALFSYEL